MNATCKTMELITMQDAIQKKNGIIGLSLTFQVSRLTKTQNVEKNNVFQTTPP